jgi:6-phosphogluconolactonase
MATESPTRLLVAKDPAEWARLAAETIAQKMVKAAKARGICSVALSGGAACRPVYEELGNSAPAETLPWDQLEFYFTDEGAVPIDDPESSYRLARETLFRSHLEAAGRCYRMPADAPDLEEGAKRYSRRLPVPLDLVVLEMGGDGSIASLAPGSPAIDEKERRVVPVPGPPRNRLTITPVVLQEARALVLVALGVEKAPLVARAIGGALDPKACPAQLARRATWVVDQAAASQMV